MAGILFAYEFGAGLGHLGILTALAKQFVGRHRIAFAAPDLPSATSYLSGALGGRFTLHRAPEWSGVASVIERRGTVCHTLADTLLLFAFDDADRLMRACRSWLNIVEAESPDVVVVDSAPTARLALEARVPMVVVGTGYTVLPGGRPLPALRPWQTRVPPRSRAAEARLLAAANDCRESLGSAAVDHLGDLFRGDANFISTLPEFDPYAAVRAPDPYTPFTLPAYAAGPPHDRRLDVPIFAYLPSAHPAVMPVIEALNETEIPSRLYLSNAIPEELAKFCRRHVRVHTTPADFSAVLPQCRVVIHHAGLGTTLAAMTAGSAQLTLPATLENEITALGLQRSGCSINMQASPAPSKEAIKAAIGRLLRGGDFADHALEAAGRIDRLRGSNAMDHVIRSVQALLPT